ncbi:MAG: leucyl aminopeptidase family protein [Saprospiraceae bacterium]|nr:leucyl aminopeptidase family protein [Saprospiraceae bacterium]
MTIFFSQSQTALSNTVVLPVASGNGATDFISLAVKAGGTPLSLIQQDFKAELGEICPVLTPTGRFFLLGVGKQPGFAEIQKAFRLFSHKMKNRLESSLHIYYAHLTHSDNLPVWVEAATNGLLLGTYAIGRFKTEVPVAHPLSSADSVLNFITADADIVPLVAAARRGEQVALTQLRIFDLVNAPGNKKTSADLSAWADNLGAQFGLRVEVLDKAQIAARGLHALIAVNMGSEDPPVFLILEHVPDKLVYPGKIGFVGKGVTFDTGGLSIKPSANMHYMKSDMGGAAAVLGLFELAARLRLPYHLVGVIPVTDNSVDARSLKPGDVIGSYSGKTIEVIDTDAEGRLLLADGLSYIIRNHHPDVVIDLATLTGSTVRTLGYAAGGLFANNDMLAGALMNAGDRCGERLWRFPLWDVYKDDIKSDVADVRNFSGKPVAGAITAAKFLEAFIDEHPAWAHLDIAGVAFNDSEFASQKSATAYGIRLLLTFLEDYLEKPANSST